MKVPHLFWLPVLCLVVLTGCASGPKFDTSRVKPGMSPHSVSAEMDSSIGATVLWGGVILDTQNLKSGTRVEVLAYPLDDNQRPMRDSDPLGRFLIQYPGFLEPATYAAGRLLTLLGTVQGSVSGKVGESDYLYPIITSQQLYLWEKDRGGYGGDNVHFGIGVGIGL